MIAFAGVGALQPTSIAALRGRARTNNFSFFHSRNMRLKHAKKLIVRARPIIYFSFNYRIQTDCFSQLHYITA